MSCDVRTGTQPGNGRVRSCEAGGEVYTRHCALAALDGLLGPATREQVTRELVARRVLVVEGYAEREVAAALEALVVRGYARRGGPAEAPMYEAVR